MSGAVKWVGETCDVTKVTHYMSSSSFRGKMGRNGSGWKFGAESEVL